MNRVSRFPAPVLVVALLIATTARPGAREPTVDEVLTRAGAYVTEFQRQLSGIVAEESYRQEVSEPSATSFSRVPLRSQGPAHRTLRSDVLLVRPQGAERWIQFRDVFEVDGTPVRDRSERLMKLFIEPTSSTATQVEQIVRESARYNIGNVQRTINVPVFALMVLDPRLHAHFKFARARPSEPSIGRPGPLPGGTVVISYEEPGPGTLITTTNHRDLPSHGRFWIDPTTGRVLVSELIAFDVALSGTIVVQYQADLLKDVLVPVAMWEQYLDRRSGTHTNGAATYSRFRQFQVKVDEKIAPIK